LYILPISALKYSLVSTKHTCTGDSNTPTNPDAKANVKKCGSLPVRLNINGKVLPIKPTAIPVSIPVKNVIKNIKGRIGKPLFVENLLIFLTAPEIIIASLKSMTPNISIIISFESAYLITCLIFSKLYLKK